MEFEDATYFMFLFKRESVMFYAVPSVGVSVRLILISQTPARNITDFCTNNILVLAVKLLVSFFFKRVKTMKFKQDLGR